MILEEFLVKVIESFVKFNFNFIINYFVLLIFDKEGFFLIFYEN